MSRWQELSIESPALRGNPLGDPHVRPLFVWTPPTYDSEPERRFPVIYLLHAMTGQARAWFNVAPFTPSLPEQLDALALDAILVAVDGWTALGGSQWIDSPAIGRYGTYLCDDVVGTIDGSFRTLTAPGNRGLAGKSSGGFAAMIWAMRRPDLFGGIATHAGDALFDVTLAGELPAAAQALRNLYGGSYERFWEDFRSGRSVFGTRTDPLLQNVYATAAAFSPTPEGGVELPFRPDTGERIDAVWERWLAFDPVRLASTHGEALRGLRALWIDAGRNDEYHLDLGAIAFHHAALAAGVPETVIRFELCDGGHRNMNHRLPLSLCYLAERLAPAG